MIKIFEGLSALSPFKREKILADAKKISKKVKSIAAKYIHIVELNSELSAEKEQIIKSLLDYNKEYGSADSGASLGDILGAVLKENEAKK